MSKPSALRQYAMVKDGVIIQVVLLNPGNLPKHLPPGVSLMTRAEAFLAGLDQGGDPDDDTTRAQQAVLLDLLAAARSATIADNADATSAGTATLSLAQLTALVRIIAGWVAVLSRHDLMTNRQLAALILRDPDDFGVLGAPPSRVTITATPGEAVASGVPLTP